MNLTSTSEETVVSGCQRLLMSHVMTKRLGGSHTMILPTFVRVPSSASSYQWPPTLVSMTAAFRGVLPMPWSSGHQRPSPAVNTSNACAWLALPRVLWRRGLLFLALVFSLFPFPLFPPFPLPPGPRPPPRPKTDRANAATPRARGGR